MITMWLITLGLSPLSAKWITRGLIIAAVAAACVSLYAAGYSAGFDSKNHAMTKSHLAQTKAMLDQIRAQQRENEQLTDDLNAARGRDRIVYRTIREKARHVDSPACEAPVAGGPAQWHVSSYFVRMWDDATFARVPESSGSADYGPARTGGAAPSSGIGFAELLNNHIDNAEIASAVRRQCQALIDWHRTHSQ